MGKKILENQRLIMEKGLAVHHGILVMNWDELTALEEKLRQKPDDFFLWAARGVLYFNEDFEKSVESFSRAIALNPLNANQYYNRGRKYLSLDRFPEALADFSAAAFLDPLDSWKWHFWGVAHFFLKHYEEALTMMYRAVDTHNSYGSGKIEMEIDWIFMICHRLGRNEEASAALELLDGTVLANMEETAYKKRVLLYKGIVSLDQYLAAVNKERDMLKITGIYAGAFYCQYVLNERDKALALLDEVLAVRGDTHAFAYKMALIDRKEWSHRD
jgi:tetratricopeptide (TPR) repeat protein